MRRGVCALALVLLASCARTSGVSSPWRSGMRTVRVDSRHAGDEGAVVNGSPTFRTLGEALRAAPADGRFVVRISNGRYREKLSVDRADVWLIGESRDSTVVTFDAASDTHDPAGVPYGTRGSFTLRITAPDFHAAHLTIENAFDYDANARKAEGDPTRYRNTQGVALATTGASDRAVFEDVRLLGHQDTFFANAGRHYFHRCEVSGHVDFIFGAGQVVFDDCDIISLDRHAADNGYITAPSTDLRQPYGFLFVHSRLRKSSPGMASRSVSLGRPWHPSATPDANGSAVYMDCWMDDHISPAGWAQMSSVDSATGTRFWFEPGSARFLEYRSTGPGALPSATRRVMSDGDARSYTVARVLAGWTPEQMP